MWIIGVILIILLIVVLWICVKEEHRHRKERTPIGRVQYFWYGQERRQNERISLVFRARYRVVKNGKRDQKESLTDNLSIGGLKLLIYEKMRAGDEIDLEIDVPPKELLKCRGKIIWVKEIHQEERGKEELGKRSFLIGVSFTQLSPQVLERLKSFINIGNPNNILAQAA